MKVYLAAAYNQAQTMQGVADVLENINQAYGSPITVTSRWISQPNLAPREQAQMDCTDLAAADVVIFFTKWPSTKGGFHTEFGLALGLDKQIVIVGQQLNIFHHLPRIKVYPGWSGLVMAVSTGLPWTWSPVNVGIL